MFGKSYLLQFLILLTLIRPEFVYAGAIWDAFVGCITDPCNCGDSDPTRKEFWDGSWRNKGDENRLCPPWKKTSGRMDNICLAGKPYPNNIYFETICAEESPASTYFEPRIRVRTQSCNFICRTTDHSLKWDGECVTLPGPYGLPLTRLCARIAVPADPTIDRPTDPGYTYNRHLNWEGASKEDKTAIDRDGNVIRYDQPKLCLYKDPAFLDLTYGPDILDLNPNNQPFHKTNQLHPVIEVLTFVIEAAASPSQMMVMLVEKLEEKIPVAKFAPITALIKAVGWLIDFAADLFVTVLQGVGKINTIVVESYGCVNLPIGPYPPPFCPVLKKAKQVPIIQQICHNDIDEYQVSLESKPCVRSSTKNNFINNAARIGFNNLVPICYKGEDPTKTDSCVNFEGMGSFFSASAMHSATSQSDIVNRCGGGLCIRTKISGSEFRVVYAIRVGETSRPIEAYVEDVPDCGSSTCDPDTDPDCSPIKRCQEVWGINAGNFTDVFVRFPAKENNSNNDIKNNFDLRDNGDNNQRLQLSIVYNPLYRSTYKYYQDPKNMCVFDRDENKVIGCVERAPFKDLFVYDCSTSYGGHNCTSTYFEPEFIAAARVDTYTTSAVIRPLTVENSESSADYSAGNLAGYNFESFVTDYEYAVQPFSGSRSETPSSIYGLYKDGEKPYDENGEARDDVVYFTGIEYVNSKYIKGGKFACIQRVETVGCPADKTQCVLTKKQSGKATLNPEDRIDPSPDYGYVLPKNVYYDQDLYGSQTYPNSQILRDKTAFENNGCIEIPQPICEAYTTDGAKWEEAKVGDLVMGVCEGNTYPVKPEMLERYCTIDADNDTGFEEKDDPECTEADCNAITENNTIWGPTGADMEVEGVCEAGYEPKGGSLKRKCVVDPDTGNAAYEPIPSSTGCKPM